MLVAGYVAGAVDYVFPASDAFAFAGTVKPLLVGAGVLAGICEPVHGCSGSWRLGYL